MYSSGSGFGGFCVFSLFSVGFCVLLLYCWCLLWVLLVEVLGFVVLVVLFGFIMCFLVCVFGGFHSTGVVWVWLVCEVEFGVWFEVCGLVCVVCRQALRVVFCFGGCLFYTGGCEAVVVCVGVVWVLCLFVVFHLGGLGVVAGRDGAVYLFGGLWISFYLGVCGFICCVVYLVCIVLFPHGLLVVLCLFCSFVAGVGGLLGVCWVRLVFYVFALFCFDSVVSVVGFCWLAPLVLGFISFVLVCCFVCGGFLWVCGFLLWWFCCCVGFWVSCFRGFCFVVWLCFVV